MKLPGYMKLIRFERDASGRLNAAIRFRRWHPSYWVLIVKVICKHYLARKNG